MSIGTKLKRLIDSRGTNVNRLARNIQVSPQTIYGIIKRNNTKVDIEVLQSLADELEVSLEYFSKGEKLQVNLEEESLLYHYKALDAYGREAIKALLKVEVARCRAEGKAHYE